MKNLLKTSLAVLTICVSLAACNGNSNKNAGDTAKADSSVSKTDTTIKVDSTKKDSAAVDTTKKAAADTISKKTIEKTVVKKEVTKK